MACRWSTLHGQLRRRPEAELTQALDFAARCAAVLRDAYQAVRDAADRGVVNLDPELIAALQERDDQSLPSGTIHNRLRDWDSGNHPGYALGCWLRE
jgi:hypothetical protein